MATSKYGVGKYGFRLYSAIPFVDYIGAGSVSVFATGSLIANYSFTASGAVSLLSTNAYLLRIQPLAAEALVDVNGAADLWTAHTQDFTAGAVIFVSGTMNLSYSINFAMAGSVDVGASGEAYLGPFWNEKECTTDVWGNVAAPVSPWVKQGCSGTWNEVTDG